MVIKQKRGQAALEFLTTYGWAFMVILVMIGALAYFGVLNPTQLIPDSCSVTSGFSCRDAEISSEGTGHVNIELVNNNGNAIRVDNIELTQAGNDIVALGGCTVRDAPGETGGNEITQDTATGTPINDGATFFIYCPTEATADFMEGNKERLGYSFDFRRLQGSFDSTASGTVTGTVR